MRFGIEKIRFIIVVNLLHFFRFNNNSLADKLSIMYLSGRFVAVL